MFARCACDEGARGVEFRAYGDEPFWDPSVSEKGIRFFELGGDRREFPYAPANVAPGRRVYCSSRLGSGEDWIIAILDEAPCVDQLSGARFSFSAHLIVGDRHYHQCGREGFHPSR